MTPGAAGAYKDGSDQVRSGVAMDVLKRLAEFTRERHPASADALLEVLEPFGHHLAEVYG